MKYGAWYLIVSLISLLEFSDTQMVVTGGNSTPAQVSRSTDSLSVCLPQNDRLAQRELQRARRALDRMQPSRPYIVIDTYSNRLFLRTQDSILLTASCSTGSGGELIDKETGRRWVFRTPKGVFTVSSKLTDPWWRKPDWAFIEENQPVPTNPSERYDPEMLGEYALGFGDNYFIHGTLYERLLGINVTHGCVRLGSIDLKKLYDAVPIGTPIYIF